MGNYKNTANYQLILVGVFTAVIVICTWICIPTPIPFTLQTLGVFVAVYLLDLKHSLLAVFTYILLGLVGLPVFSGFQGGAGVLMGPTGGYIAGFAVIALTVGIGKKFVNGNFISIFIIMATGLILCYALGTLWYMYIMQTNLVSALLICVVPYVVFDFAKLFVAIIVGNKVKKHIKTG